MWRSYTIRTVSSRPDPKSAASFLRGFWDIVFETGVKNAKPIAWDAWQEPEEHFGF